MKRISLTRYLIGCFFILVLNAVGPKNIAGSTASFTRILETKLTASDAAVVDRFGASVSISGDTAVVAAGDDDDGGSGSGSAYIFHRNQGGLSNWGEVTKLTASDAAAEDHFGASVSISGDTAVVGARNDDDAGFSSGSAYIFHRDQGGVGNWGEVTKLTASDAAASDVFGASVSISGDTAVVAALFDDDAGSKSGSAYIFQRDEGGIGNWGEVTKLTASDAAAEDHFGVSVSISGDTAVVGAHHDDDYTGSAYVFHRDEGGVGNWGEVTKLTASDAAAGDWFGASVSISGDTAVVGAQRNDDAGFSSGSAYIFHRDQGGVGYWGEVTKLTASDAAAGDWFGVSVSISGDTVVVGAKLDDNASGSAYIFQRDEGGVGNWGEVTKLTASDAAVEDEFGWSVSNSGDMAVVGAPWDDDAGSDSGSAYLYATGVSVCSAPAIAVPELTVPDVGFGSRIRYLSFSGGTGSASEAVRVQFDIGNGPRTMWVGQLGRISEASGDAGPTEPAFWAATLQCAPYFTDWSAYASVHVRSESIVPAESYDLTLVSEGCESEATAFSVPLPVSTSIWGDLLSVCDGGSCGPPSGAADFDDISAVVDKFRNLPGAPTKSRADVAPAIPDFRVDFIDIPDVVDGFRGLPYPYAPPVDPCGL